MVEEGGGERKGMEGMFGNEADDGSGGRMNCGCGTVGMLGSGGRVVGSDGCASVGKFGNEGNGGNVGFGKLGMLGKFGTLG